jgi:hypothetical protein
MLKQTKITDYFHPVISMKEIQEQVNLEYLHNRCLQIKDTCSKEYYDTIREFVRDVGIVTEYVLALGNKLKDM